MVEANNQESSSDQVKVLSLKEQADLRGPPTSEWVTK